MISTTTDQGFTIGRKGNRRHYALYVRGAEGAASTRRDVPKKYAGIKSTGCEQSPIRREIQ